MNVEIYIDELPKNQKMIADFLRQELYNTVVGIEEKLSYRMPFFLLSRPFVLLQP